MRTHKNVVRVKSPEAEASLPARGFRAFDSPDMEYAVMCFSKLRECGVPGKRSIKRRCRRITGLFTAQAESVQDLGDTGMIVIPFRNIIRLLFQCIFGI